MEQAKKVEPETAEEMSIIGSGIRVTGNIEATDDLHLLGKVDGDVRCVTLILGEKSVIRGSVFAERVRAAGTVEGSIETKDLAVEATARLNGDITYSRIRIASGGIIDGKMIYRESEEEAGGDARLRLVESGPAGKPEAARPEPKAVYIE
jgi:cytoskeletal protein CcmA (bactofilin family)